MDLSLSQNFFQAFWYYAMMLFLTFGLKSHPIAQFEEKRIICKKNAYFK